MSSKPSIEEHVGFTKYKLIKSGMHNSYQVQNDIGTVVYCVRNSHFTAGAPDLIVHDGADQTKPLLAAAQIHKALRYMRVALGNDWTPDEDVEKFTAWIPVKKNDPHTHWSHAFAMPSSADTVGGYSPPYVWERTRDVEELPVKGIAKTIKRHYKLRDANTGEVVAVLARSGKWSEKGTFHIKESMNRDEHVIVMLTAISLLEKKKRGWVYFWHTSGYGPYGTRPGMLLLLAAA